MSFEAGKVFKDLSFVDADMTGCEDRVESLIMMEEGSEVVKHFRADKAAVRLERIL